MFTTFILQQLGLAFMITVCRPMSKGGLKLIRGGACSFPSHIFVLGLRRCDVDNCPLVAQIIEN